MALKSGGTIPTTTAMLDANQIIQRFSTLHHWACTKENRQDRTGYSVSITHAGHRVTAYRPTFVTAANAALAKLGATEPPKLRLAR